MAKVIAIINQKGGVGKTTTAVNLSALLGAMGQRVLMIDLDPQGNTTSGLGMEVDDKSIYEVIMGRMKLTDVMEETEFKNLSIAGSDVRLANAELELVEVEKREYRLKTAVQSVQQDFDFIFIDCPPSLGLLTINALTAADGVVGEGGEDGGERLALRSRAAAPFEVHHVEKTVVDIARIGLVYEVVRDAVVYKGFDVIFHRFSIVKCVGVGGKDLGLVQRFYTDASITSITNGTASVPSHSLSKNMCSRARIREQRGSLRGQGPPQIQ